MDLYKFSEGNVRKGGHNPPPTTPKPNYRPPPQKPRDLTGVSLVSGGITYPAPGFAKLTAEQMLQKAVKLIGTITEPYYGEANVEQAISNALYELKQNGFMTELTLRYKVGPVDGNPNTLNVTFYFEEDAN